MVLSTPIRRIPFMDISILQNNSTEIENNCDQKTLKSSKRNQQSNRHNHFNATKYLPCKERRRRRHNINFKAFRKAPKISTDFLLKGNFSTNVKQNQKSTAFNSERDEFSKRSESTDEANFKQTDDVLIITKSSPPMSCELLLKGKSTRNVEQNDDFRALNTEEEDVSNKNKSTHENALKQKEEIFFTSQSTPQISSDCIMKGNVSGNIPEKNYEATLSTTEKEEQFYKNIQLRNEENVKQTEEMLITSKITPLISTDFVLKGDTSHDVHPKNDKSNLPTSDRKVLISTHKSSSNSEKEFTCRSTLTTAKTKRTNPELSPLPTNGQESRISANKTCGKKSFMEVNKSQQSSATTSNHLSLIDGKIKLPNGQTLKIVKYVPPTKVTRTLMDNSKEDFKPTSPQNMTQTFDQNEVRKPQEKANEKLKSSFSFKSTKTKQVESNKKDVWMDTTERTQLLEHCGSERKKCQIEDNEREWKTWMKEKITGRKETGENDQDTNVPEAVGNEVFFQCHHKVIKFLSI